MKRATIADIIRGFVPRNHVRSGVHLQLPAEESFRYSYQPNRWHPHDKIVTLVGANKRVLDVGCSSGYLAKRFKENGCIVSGIERDPAAGEQARAYSDVIHLCAAEALPASTFPEGAFDVIVYADILEHMVDPAYVLRAQRRWLSPHGYAIVSIPNVAFAGIRLHLLLGRFDYKDFGILDRTHLRFYTLKTAKTLLGHGGYIPKRMDCTGRLAAMLPTQFAASLCASGFVFQAAPEDRSETRVSC